jgi:hypothetical protein
VKSTAALSIKKKPPFQESGLGFLKEKKNSTPNKIKSMK